MDPTSASASAARSRLEAEKTRLTGLLDDVEKDFEREGGISQSADAGVSTTFTEANRGIAAGLRDELEEVQAALRRVEDGTYGIDEITGDPIDPARLEVEPAARTNVGS